MVRLQDWLEKYMHKDYAYLIVSGIILVLSTSWIFFVSFMFGNLLFAIINSIILNQLRKYTFGFHLSTTIRCISLTTIVIAIFCYISRMSVCHLWAILLLFGYSVRDIYLKAPISHTNTKLEYRWYNTRPFIYIWKALKINTSKYDKPYNLEWHRRGIIRWLVIPLFFIFIFLLLRQYIVVSCIALSVVMCDMLMFLNTDEFL